MEEQALWRRGRAGLPSIAGSHHLTDPVRWPPAPPHLDQAADDVADHVVEKPVGFDFQGPTPAPQRRCQRQGIESPRLLSPVTKADVADGRLAGGAGGLKTGEIVPSHDPTRGRDDRVEIDVDPQSPAVAIAERVGGAAHTDAIAIAFRRGVSQRVKMAGRLDDVLHGDRIRQFRLQRPGQGVG